MYACDKFACEKFNILLSDQGCNFESTIFKQTLEAFGVTKVRTTAYHPQGDRMVERFNVQLFQTLENWEEHLPLLLYTYRTSVHSSTGFSPFTLMYGRQPKSLSFSPPKAFDPVSYQAHLQTRLAKLQTFVKSHLANAATAQRLLMTLMYSTMRNFQVDDRVWLSIPTSCKLDTKWERGWKVKTIKSPVNMEIMNGQRTKIVHINRLQHCVQRSCKIYQIFQPLILKFGNHHGQNTLQG